MTDSNKAVVERVQKRLDAVKALPRSDRPHFAHGPLAVTVEFDAVSRLLAMVEEREGLLDLVKDVEPLVETSCSLKFSKPMPFSEKNIPAWEEERERAFEPLFRLRATLARIKSMEK